MYETQYNPWTGILTVTGNHLEIDDALYDGRIDRARKAYRSGNVPPSGLRVTENNGVPFKVTIKVKGSGNIYADPLEMKVSPVLNPFQKRNSRARIQSLKITLDEHVESIRRKTA